MNTLRAALLALVLGAGLSGCYNLKYYSTTHPGPGDTHSIWVHSFILGLATIGEINLDAECPTGVYRLKSNQNFVDILLAGFTFGIYTPMNVVITCASGPGA
jgi:hypothetical protein